MPGLGIAFLLAACATPHPARMADSNGGWQTVNPAYLHTADRRTFRIEYVAKVDDIPAGTKTLRLWVPVPQDSTVQTIRDLSFSRPARIGVERKYGNAVAYWEIPRPGACVEVTMTFVCARREVRTDLKSLRTDGIDPPGSFAVFHRPDRLVIVDEEIRRLSDEITRGRTGALDKGRAIYEYVLARMDYDKSHPGWGTGSTVHACKVGKGNCTDFHALFNSLCRAQGIASGFEIGLYLPYERHKEEKLGGYHCWALFRVPGKTWVPVDCSEADRIPKLEDYFFGGHTSNRVTFSTGRDIVLEPPQSGEPLNYFVNPHAEADGVPVKAEKDWSFRDLE